MDAKVHTDLTIPTGRSLTVFIKRELDEGDGAATSAAQPFYARAGLGMLHATARFDGKNARAEFWDWAVDEFGEGKDGRKRTQKLLRSYMEIAFENRGLHDFAADTDQDLDDFLRRVLPPLKRDSGGRKAQKATRAETRAFATGAEYKAPAAETSARKEKELRRALSLLVIDTGYKTLAVKLHPDKKTGDVEAMTRLNAVVALLRKAVKDA